MTAFGDPLSCELGQTAELLRLWQGIGDPRAQARVRSAMRMAAGRYGATAERAEPEPDPVA